MIHYPVLPTPTQPPLVADGEEKNLDWIENSLVGRHVRKHVTTPYGTVVSWWAKSVLRHLGYEVRLHAPGPGPTADQMAGFEELAFRMPTLIAAASLWPTPEVDPWGMAAPPFDIRTAPIEEIRLYTDGRYRVYWDVDRSGTYMLGPLVIVGADFSLVEGTWSM